MLLILLAIILSSQSLIAAHIFANATWPDPSPKQLNAVRRRQGLTTAELLDHHTIVHGRKSRTASDSPEQPIAYVQGRVFDSASDISTMENKPQPSYLGHSDMTELYIRSQEAFVMQPPHNYTATVIGRNGCRLPCTSGSLQIRDWKYEGDEVGRAGYQRGFDARKTKGLDEAGQSMRRILRRRRKIGGR
jgi:hypothetical protein